MYGEFWVFKAYTWPNFHETFLHTPVCTLHCSLAHFPLWPFFFFFFFTFVLMMLPLPPVLLPFLFNSLLSIKTQIKFHHLHHFFSDVTVHNFSSLDSLLFQHYLISYSYNNLYYHNVFIYCKTSNYSMSKKRQNYFSASSP